MSLRRIGYVLALAAAGSLAAVAQDFTDLANQPVKGHSASADVKVPEVHGVLVQADFNTDYKEVADSAVRAQLKECVEGSVSFMIDVPFKKIVANMLKPGTLGKVSPNIESYTAKVSSEDEHQVTYKIHETLVPFHIPLMNLRKSEANLDLSVNKDAIKGGRVVIDFALDSQQKNDWKRFSGSIYGVDLHDGSTMIMVQTSTKSGYNLLPVLRLKLAKYFLGKTKDNLVKWMDNL